MPYEPHCPAWDCTGGRAHRLHQVDADFVHMPAEIRNRSEPDQVIFRCSYCGLIWFQRASVPPGFDPSVVGRYPAREANDFRPLERYDIRERETLQDTGSDNVSGVGGASVAADGDEVPRSTATT